MGFLFLVLIYLWSICLLLINHNIFGIKLFQSVEGSPLPSLQGFVFVFVFCFFFVFFVLFSCISESGSYLAQAGLLFTM